MRYKKTIRGRINGYMKTLINFFMSYETVIVFDYIGDMESDVYMSAIVCQPIKEKFIIDWDKRKIYKKIKL